MARRRPVAMSRAARTCPYDPSPSTFPNSKSCTVRFVSRTRSIPVDAADDDDDDDDVVVVDDEEEDGV
jgi:hypothetical protein